MTTTASVESLDVTDEAAATAIARAVGEELRRVREAKGWSRRYLVTRLPSGIGARTLLSYEHGARHLTVLRFVEVCRAMRVSAPDVLGLGLQRARLHLENLPLWVDLGALASDGTIEFRFVVMWAHNKLVQHPAGVVQVAPAGVDELATVVGCSPRELAVYLTRFTPEVDQIPEDDDHARSAVN
jgi:transcriptional regulator with XRE-family HTH domain